jgi:anaerobic magnesium-protoporphyrin IX monomethyl ester cyclase
MRGRNFETFSFDRVIADIQDAYDYGARSIFIVDDNITLNVKRFAGLCEAIIAAGLNSIDDSVQAMTSAIANHGELLANAQSGLSVRLPRDRKLGRCRSRILTR